MSVTPAADYYPAIKEALHSASCTGLRLIHGSEAAAWTPPNVWRCEALRGVAPNRPSAWPLEGVAIGTASCPLQMYALSTSKTPSYPFSRRPLDYQADCGTLLPIRAIRAGRGPDHDDGLLARTNHRDAVGGSCHSSYARKPLRL